MPDARFGDLVPAVTRTEPVALLARSSAAADLHDTASGAAEAASPAAAAPRAGLAPAPLPGAQSAPASRETSRAQAAPLASTLSGITASLRATEGRLSSVLSLLAAAGRARAAAAAPAAAPAPAPLIPAAEAGAAAPVARRAAVPLAAAVPAAQPSASAPASARTQKRQLQPMDEETVAKRLRLALDIYRSSLSSAGSPSAIRGPDSISFQSVHDPISLEDMFAAAVAWQIANG